MKETNCVLCDYEFGCGCSSKHKKKICSCGNSTAANQKIIQVYNRIPGQEIEYIANYVIENKALPIASIVSALRPPTQEGADTEKEALPTECVFVGMGPTSKCINCGRPYWHYKNIGNICLINNQE